jgi:hypothetical protein
LPESARTEKYNDRSWNLVNDHYDSGVNYDKMYGALVQRKNSESKEVDDYVMPWYLTMGPFAMPRIYQDVDDHASYFPNANQLMA